MSDQKKSPIVSTTVSLNAKDKPKIPGKSYKKVKTPWHILICSDLGFVSQKPEPVRAAELNSFISACNITLRGTMTSVIAGKDEFIEYPVKDLKDFSSGSIRKILPLTAPLLVLSETLEDLIKGTVSCEQAIKTIQEQTTGSSFFTQALQIINPVVLKKGADAPQQVSAVQTGTEKASMLDSILDSVAVEETETVPVKTPQTPVDTLAQAITGDSSVQLPKDKIQSLCERIEKQIADDVTTLLSQPFFRDSKSSWLSMRHLLKQVGRNDAVTVSVLSVPFSELTDRFADACASLGQQGNPPDIVLCDYPFLFTNAHADILAQVAECAEQNHSMILANVSLEEPFISRIPGADTLKPFFDEPIFISFHRLRKNSCARMLCMGAPHGVIDASEDVVVSAGGGWLILFSLVQRIVDGRSPFDGGVTLADTCITAEYPLRYARGINQEHTLESLESGITLFSDILATQAGIPAVTVIDTEGIASQYTSFSYNLLTNHLLKITESVIQAGGKDAKEIAEQLRRELVTFLDDCRMLHSQDEVTVTCGDSGEISVVIDSPKTVDEYPIRIEYSVNG